jgi:hypothetical protein
LPTFCTFADDRLEVEVVGRLVVELVDLIEMASEDGVIGKALGTQGTLVNVWKMYLYMESSLDGVM